MKLHIFNPEHDIALAYNRRHQTMPHAAQELRMNLGWLPALWADEGDVLLVDDARYAVKAASKMKGFCQEVLFLEKTDIRGLRVDDVMPWGWDRNVLAELQEAGVVCSSMPSEAQVDIIRQLSSRRNVPQVLKEVRRGLEPFTCGEAVYAESMDDVSRLLKEWGRAVLKAPWSSSGRGVRFVENTLDKTVGGWAECVIRQQGGIMVEPYYSKIRDFGMEFEITDGRVIYCGLSLFETRQQAYTGNILADEDTKREMLARYIDLNLLDEVQRRLEHELELLIGNDYSGPLGVDMMVNTEERGERREEREMHQPSAFSLHPCVEINLRRTMGHVALAFKATPFDAKRLMSIVHEVNYKLKLSNIENNYVQVL